MIKIINSEVFGWEASIRGLRSPMNSWDKSDSHMCNCDECAMIIWGDEPAEECNDGEYAICIGKNDLKLMKSLVKAGSDHSKFMRMINVTMDITAPMYWWKEFDTYKVGTVRNSCSTMHKITEKEFNRDDFSCNKLWEESLMLLDDVIKLLNHWRGWYNSENVNHELNKKDIWWQIIQLLPSSYNQRSTVQLNYAVLRNIYHSRKNHKLDEWRDFCSWIESLPYGKDLICYE